MRGITVRKQDFDPRDIQGCVCWLRSDLDVGAVSGNVATWRNQVRGMPGDASQFITAKQPTYGSGIRGLPKLTFSGSQGLVWPLDMSGPKTIYAVMKCASLPHSGFSICSIKASAGPVFSEIMLDLATYQTESYICDVSNLTQNGVGSAMALDTTSIHSVGMCYDGGTVNAQTPYVCFFDGARQSPTIASGGFSRVLTDLGSIGARLDASQGVSFGFNGDLYELIVHDRALQNHQTSLESETNALSGYFHLRYGI